MCLSVYVGLHGLLITLILMILTRLSQFFGVPFFKSHKPKNWLYNACLKTNFPSSRSTSFMYYSP